MYALGTLEERVELFGSPLRQSALEYSNSVSAHNAVVTRSSLHCELGFVATSARQRAVRETMVRAH